MKTNTILLLIATIAVVILACYKMEEKGVFETYTSTQYVSHEDLLKSLESQHKEMEKYELNELNSKENELFKELMNNEKTLNEFFEGFRFFHSYVSDEENYNRLLKYVYSGSLKKTKKDSILIILKIISRDIHYMGWNYESKQIKNSDGTIFLKYNFTEDITISERKKNNLGISTIIYTKKEVKRKLILNTIIENDTIKIVLDNVKLKNKRVLSRKDSIKIQDKEIANVVKHWEKENGY